jgi:hypothetical protein
VAVGRERIGGRKQEAEAGSWFMIVEAGMEARGWIREAGKHAISLKPLLSI